MIFIGLRQVRVLPLWHYMMMMMMMMIIII